MSRLRIVVALVITVVATITYAYSTHGDEELIERKIVVADLLEGANFGASVALEGDLAVIGAPLGAGVVEGTGAAFVFRHMGGEWVLIDELMSGDGEADDRFGAAVAVDGTTIVVGAPGDDDGGGNAGAVYVFTDAADDWTETDKLTPSVLGDTFFGFSVAVDAGTIAVGAPYTDSGFTNSGAVYLFDFDAGWSESKRLATGGGGAVESDLFGWAVDLSDDLLIVGAYLDDMTYVYTRVGADWQEVDTLTGSDTEGTDRFGYAVATDGVHILVGATHDDEAGNNAGAAYLFGRIGGMWEEIDKWTPGVLPPSNGANFGWTVAVSGDRAVIGAPNSPSLTDEEEAGALYLYAADGVGWSQDALLNAADGAAFDHLGTSVATDAQTTLGGAPGHDAIAADAGAVYSYRGDDGGEPGDVQVCTVEEQTTEAVLPGVNLTWDSAFRCLDTPDQGLYLFTMGIDAAPENDTAVTIDEIVLTHTTPRPLGQAPFASIETVTGIPVLLAAGQSAGVSVGGQYTLTQTDEGRKANLHFCARGHSETTGEVFYLGLNTLLRGPGALEDSNGPASGAPVISDVTVAPQGLSAVVSWRTNHPATSEAFFHPTDQPNMIRSASEGCMTVEEHVLLITDLLPTTEYTYWVQSRIGDSTPVVSEKQVFRTFDVTRKLYLAIVRR